MLGDLVHGHIYTVGTLGLKLGYLITLGIIYCCRISCGRNVDTRDIGRRIDNAHIQAHSGTQSGCSGAAESKHHCLKEQCAEKIPKLGHRGRYLFTSSLCSAFSVI